MLWFARNSCVLAQVFHPGRWHLQSTRAMNVPSLHARSRVIVLTARRRLPGDLVILAGEDRARRREACYQCRLSPRLRAQTFWRSILRLRASSRIRPGGSSSGSSASSKVPQ